MKPQFEQGFLHPTGFDTTGAPQRRQRAAVLGTGTDGAGTLEEGVGATLAADCGFGSMTAVHDGVIAQAEQLLLDAVNEGIEVPAEQVRAADRSLEQHVAGERYPVPHEGHTARRVAGGMADLELEPAGLNGVAVCERMVRRGKRHPGHAEDNGLVGGAIVEWPVGGVEVHRRSGFCADPCDAVNVIDVRVGEPDRGAPGPCGREALEDEPALLARIDDRAGFRRVIYDEVTVLGKSTVGDCDDLHVASAAFSFNAARYFSTAIAAVVASPTAVVIWRVSWLRTSPAAKRPGMDVIIRSSVMRYPPASCFTWLSTSCVLGWKPMKTNTPPTLRDE